MSARRARGTVAEPERLADGSWSCRVRWEDADGERRSERVRGTSATEARQLGHLLLAKHVREAEEVRVGVRLAAPVKTPTLAVLAQRAAREFLPTRQAPAQRLRTLLILDRVWLPQLGQTPIAELTRGEVRRVLAELRRQGKSAATCNRAVAALSVVCAFALELELIRVNPARGMQQPEGRKIPRYLSAEEAARVIAAAEPRWRPFFATALYTGMRLGELAALRWADVDLERGLIHVRGSHGNDAPKSGHQRTVRVMGQLGGILGAMPKGEPGHLVFPGRPRRGRAPDPTCDRVVAPRKALLRALRAAGIDRHLSMHDLRHTFATLYLDAGASPRDLQEALGHSSLAMSSRYVHVTGKKPEIALPER